MRHMLSSILLLSFTLLFSAEVLAKKITILGKASQLKGKEIRCYRYLDYISMRREKIADSQIDQEDKFQLSMNLESVAYLTLEIDGKTTYFYGEPGKVYNISISDPVLSNKNRQFSKTLTLKFLFPKPKELNTLILTYIDNYTEFLIKNEKQIVARRASASALKFEEKMNNKFKGVNNRYFEEYLKYNIAALKDGVIGNKGEIFRDLLHGQAILAHHYEYINFFQQFYRRKFADIALGKNGLDILSAINGTGGYSKLSTIVKKEKYISENDTFCELFILNGLKESYYDKELFRKGKVQAMLKFISQNGINRQMAENILHELTYLTKGTTAPEFELKDLTGEVCNLKRFKGKPLYIHFWSSTSTPSIRQMVLISELHQKYGEQVGILSINLDQDSKKMAKYIKTDYSWVHAHGNEDMGIQEKYRLKSLPTYVLIDKNGKIVQHRAPGPANGIERLIAKL